MSLAYDQTAGAQDGIGRRGEIEPLPDRPLRILMPSYRSHPHTGGQGVYMRHVSRCMADLGHQVDVISGPPYPELDPRIGLIKLPSLDLYAKEKVFLGLPAYPKDEVKDWTDVLEYLLHISGGFGEPYTFGRRLSAYMRTCKKQYDVVHDNQTLAYGLIDLKRMGIPVVGTIHHPITKDRDIAVAHADTISLNLLTRRWYSFLKMQMKVARQLDPVIVVSESTRRDVQSEFKIDEDKLSLVYHGIETDKFRPLPHIKRKPNRIMTTTSADVPIKGLLYLVRAYAELLKEFPDLELLTIGKLREGPAEKLIRELGIGKNIKFVSGVSDEEIVELYAETTIAVCPSLYEGFGFPAGEAMSSGVPVVSTTGGSLPEVVGDAGVLVPPGDASALAAGIAGLLRDPKRRDILGAKARERILREFVWSKTGENLVKIYRQAIADANSRS
jgi:glycosyltransferase involved in cell wall biosynthesis